MNSAKAEPRGGLLKALLRCVFAGQIPPAGCRIAAKLCRI